MGRPTEFLDPQPVGSSVARRFLRSRRLAASRNSPNGVVFRDPLKGTLTRAESHMCPLSSTSPARPLWPAPPSALLALAAPAAGSGWAGWRRSPPSPSGGVYGVPAAVSSPDYAATAAVHHCRWQSAPVLDYDHDHHDHHAGHPPPRRPRLLRAPTTTPRRSWLGARPPPPARPRPAAGRPPCRPTATPPRGAARRRWPTSRPMRLRASPSTARDTPRATRP